VQNYDVATRVASTTDVAIVGPLVGRLEVHETSLTSAIALMGTRRQMRRREDCLKLLTWMEHMHFDASSPNVRDNIRQWRSVVDSLGPDVPVKYNQASGLPMKFSANALGLLLDLVVDRLRGTTHDGGAGTARMGRLQRADAPFTGEPECAARLYAGCISRVHAETFAQQVPLLRDAQERNSAPPLLPLVAQPSTLPQVPSSLGAVFGQPSTWDMAVAQGMRTVVQATNASPPQTATANPPLPPGPPPPLGSQQSPAVSVSPPHDDEVDYEND
jgi:hypothetical protein